MAEVWVVSYDVEFVATAWASANHETMTWAAYTSLAAAQTAVAARAPQLTWEDDGEDEPQSWTGSEPDRPAIYISRVPLDPPMLPGGR